MIVRPQKTEIVVTHLLRMPTGIAVTYEAGIPFMVVSKLIEITEDLEVVNENKQKEL